MGTIAFDAATFTERREGNRGNHGALLRSGYVARASGWNIREGATRNRERGRLCSRDTEMSSPRQTRSRSLPSSSYPGPPPVSVPASAVLRGIARLLREVGPWRRPIEPLNSVRAVGQAKANSVSTQSS